MEPITKEQEIRIDNSSKYFGEIRHERENGDIILANDIYLYGEVDFDNIDDLKYIEKFKLLFNEPNSNWIQSNFDFDKGCFTTKEGIAKGSPTLDPIKWFKYNYVLIGKPQSIIVYKKHPLNKYVRRRNINI